MNYNKTIIAGNLTADPKIRDTKTGVIVAQFTLALNHRRKDGSEETSFVDVTFFGKNAEVIRDHVVKGRNILVEGRLKQETWEAHDGTNRSKVVVIGENFKFTGPPKKDNPQPKKETAVSSDASYGDTSIYRDDDIPF